jgi:hypothetical protein
MEIKRALQPKNKYKSLETKPRSMAILPYMHVGWLVGIPHWPIAVRGKNLTMYIHIISGQTSHHSLMMEAEMVSESLGFYPQLIGLLPEKILSSSFAAKASSIMLIILLETTKSKAPDTPVSRSE